MARITPRTIHLLYATFFKGTRWDVYARSKDEARALAASHFGARKTQHKRIHVTLVDGAGQPTSPPIEGNHAR